MIKRYLGCAAVAWAMAVGAASAGGESGPGEQPGGRTPPREAVEACTGKSAGAEVEITTPRGDTLKAVCRQLGGQLVAVPEGGPPGGGGNGDREPPAGRPGER